MIEFCFSKKNEINEIKSFINNNWKKNHILAQNNNLLEWMYCNNHYCNFFLSKKNDNIIGLLGFIKNSHYDNAINKFDIVWLALWAVNESLAPPGLGVLMLKKLENEFIDISIGVLGINKSHPLIYKALNYATSKMNHYFVANRKKKKFTILKIKDFNVLPYPIANNDELSYNELKKEQILSKENIFELRNIDAIKTKKYFYNKYLNNPFYKYKVFHLTLEKEEAIIVLRKISLKKSSVIRIIDFEGSEKIISKLGNFLNHIFINENCEYIDFLQYGIEQKIFYMAGFKLLEDLTEVIMPNYFEPLINENKDILFAYKKLGNIKFNIYKGDGDQDRPNIIMNYD